MNTSDQDQSREVQFLYRCEVEQCGIEKRSRSDLSTYGTCKECGIGLMRRVRIEPAKIAISETEDARRHCLSSLLSRLGGDGETAFHNGMTSEQLADEIWTHTQWLEDEAESRAVENLRTLLRFSNSRIRELEGAMKYVFERLGDEDQTEEQKDHVRPLLEFVDEVINGVDLEGPKNMSNIEINEFCDDCEDPIGYFCRGTVEPRQFIEAIGEFLDGLGAERHYLDPDDVKHLRWKHKTDPNGPEDQNAQLVEAAADDPEGFDATYIRYCAPTNIPLPGQDVTAALRAIGATGITFEDEQ